MKTKIDPVSEVLGTGYLQFEDDTGCDGLCKFVGDEFHLLAVVSRQRGTGQFRNFIQLLKHRHSIIKIWSVDNPWLPEILVRYGFRPWQEKFCYQGEWEVCDGWRWDR